MFRKASIAIAAALGLSAAAASALSAPDTLKIDKPLKNHYHREKSIRKGKRWNDPKSET